MTTQLRKILPASLLGALLLFVGLWLLDFPKPMIDDLFYCGAALNLTADGGLENPLLARQEFPTTFFFVYPPIHSYALAGWLKILGISAKSMTGYQLAMWFIATGCIIFTLRHHSASKWLEWLSPFAISAAFLPIGLRPEPTSVAISLAGFALIECGFRHRTAIFAAFLLLFLGILTAPRVAPFEIALIGFAITRLVRAETSLGLRRYFFLGTVLLAAGGAAFVFLLMIHFQFVEFWTVFQLHAKRVSSSKLFLFRRFLFESIGVTQWPLLFFAGTVWVIVLRHLKNRLAQISIGMAIGFIGAFAIGGLGHGTLGFVVFALFTGAGALLAKVSVASRRILLVLITSVVLVAISRNLLMVCGMLTRRISPEQGTQAEVARHLIPSPQHPLLIDTSVARYLYNYRIPNGCLDFAFAAPFPGTAATDVPLQSNDIFLIGPSEFESLRKKGASLEIPPQWKPIPFDRWAFHSYPRWIYLIPAESLSANLKDQDRH